MNKYEKDKSFEHAVVYVLLKNKNTSDVVMKEIIYVADIYHLLEHSLPITKNLFLYQNSYELSHISINKMMHRKNQLLMKYKKEDELVCLSDSEKIALDFAMARYSEDFCFLPDRIVKNNS